MTPISSRIAPQPQGCQSLQLQNLLSALLFTSMLEMLTSLVLRRPKSSWKRLAFVLNRLPYA